MSNKWWGLFGEIYTIVYFICKGYRILAWNYRKGKFEIDIIAAKKQTIIFIEVKFRKKLEDFVQPVGLLQINRIKHCARHYLHDKSLYGRYPFIRFDLVIITNFIKLRHFVNIWNER